MSTKRIKAFSILGCMVALLAIFMFSYFSFAGNSEKNLVESKTINKDAPTAAKIGMSFKIAGRGNLVFNVFDEDKNDYVPWDITKELVFNDLNEQ